MRELKFRGLSERTGEFVYGYYVPICPMSSNPGIVDDDDFVHEVKPNSIALPVGYDADGQEIYEGDELISTDPNDPNPYTAHLIGVVTIKGEQFPRFAPDKFRLKEPKT